MSPITLYSVFKNLTPAVIMTGGSLYQEHLNGTAKEDLFYPLAGRACFYIPGAVTPYVKEKLFDSKFTGQIIALLMVGGAALFAAKKGYSQIGWSAELLVIFLSNVAHAKIHQHTMPIKTNEKRPGLRIVGGPDSQTLNQKRAAALLNAFVSLGTIFVNLKLEGMRNGELPLKPYLCFHAGVLILSNASFYAEVPQKVDRTVKAKVAHGLAPIVFPIVGVAHIILINGAMLMIAKKITGESIQVDLKGLSLAKIALVSAKFFL